MPLIRGKHSFDDQFTQIPNAWVRDNRLSLQARGLLVQLMSHAPGWKVTQESLAHANNIGRDAMRSILNELIEFGYLEKSEKRERNANGTLGGYVYTTHEPTQAEPMLAEPTQAEPTHKNNNLKEEQSKEEKAKNKQENLSEYFAEFWSVYPRKLDKGKAERAFKTAIKKTSPEEIIRAAERYRDDPTRKDDFTKYPATWLNAESWNNEPDPKSKALEEWLNE